MKKRREPVNLRRRFPGCSRRPAGPRTAGDEIERGESAKATRLAAAHLDLSHANTLESGEHETVQAKLVSAASFDVPKATAVG